MASIKEIEDQIVSEFDLYEDWMDKYNYIIEIGKSLPSIEEQYKTKQYVISGCQSQVWLHAKYDEGKVIFQAESDAIITKGIIGLLLRVLSNQTPEDIIESKLEFVDAIGLKEHLSPTRSNGLLSMIKQIKLYALAFKAKNKQQNTMSENILELEGKIVDAIKEVYDPEIPVNVYDLGLIYEIDLDENKTVHIKMTLTAPNCPVAESLPIEVRDKAKSVEGVTGAEIEVVFDPPWSKDMMSDVAKLELGFL